MGVAVVIGSVTLLCLCWWVIRFSLSSLTSIPTFLRVIRQLLQLLSATKSHLKLHTQGEYSIADEWEKLALASPSHVCFIQAEDGTKRTWQEVEQLANQVAYAFRQITSEEVEITTPIEDKKRAGMVLVMSNTVDYVPLWYGIIKAGHSTALVNTNLVGKSFLHAVKCGLLATAKISIDPFDESSLISDEERSDAMKTLRTGIVLIESIYQKVLSSEIEILREQGFNIQFWTCLPTNTLQQFQQIVINSSSSSTQFQSLTLSISSNQKSLRQWRNGITEKSSALFIFTSGTTGGLPKACHISHTKFMLAGLLYPVLCRLSSADLLYSPLPLYHSSAGMISICGIMRSNSTLLIRKKFSTSKFLDDCQQYQVTAIQYIGELCRYLVTFYESIDGQKRLLKMKDTNSLKIRVALGNGLRSEYWERFKNLFDIEQIVEFYSATEGNVALFNATNKVGALGYIPPFLSSLYPVRFVQIDPMDSSQLLRDPKTGKCIEAPVNQPGLLLSAVNLSGGPERRFEGYSNPNATHSKILRNVFEDGDAYFNTGDLLRRDAEGYFYWVDRTGDTFRWKGENVSTPEVAQAIEHILGSAGGINVMEDAVVYGVEVPGSEGRAGMVTIVQVGSSSMHFPWKRFIEGLQKELPSYARPLFVRLKASGEILPQTSTHKYITNNLAIEAFYPSRVGGDEVFMWDTRQNSYLPMTDSLCNDLVEGRLKL